MLTPFSVAYKRSVTNGELGYPQNLDGAVARTAQSTSLEWTLDQVPRYRLTQAEEDMRAVVGKLGLIGGTESSQVIGLWLAVGDVHAP